MTSIWDRIWPHELDYLKDNPKAIPLAPGQFPEMCPNCGGHQIMMVYIIENGPYSSPTGGKLKWLDLEPNDENRPSVSGWYAGKLEVAHCPVCKSGHMETWLEHNCGLYGDDLAVTLQDFKDLEGKSKALTMARRLIGMDRAPGGFVTYHGAYGTGKSHLLKAIVNAFRLIGIRSRYSTLADLLADIRERFGDDRGSVAVEDAIEQYRRVPVLCLDEVADPDRANLTGWAKETIFRLLDARYNDKAQVLTVIASNVHPDRMGPEWGYLRSRMDGGEVIEVSGKDMRKFAVPPVRFRKEPAPEPPEPDYPVRDTAGAMNLFTKQHEMKY